MNRYSAFSDQDLLLLLKQNDERAFDELYLRYWQKIWSVAQNKLQHAAEAEELVQDIFVSLWERRHNLDIQFSLGHYLAISVKYQVIRIINRHGYQKKYTDYARHLPQYEDDVNKQMDFKDLQEALSYYVNQLPEKCKLVYKLSRDEGYSQKQIANYLHIAEKTVEAHLGKAIRFLRSKLVHLLTFLFLLLRF